MASFDNTERERQTAFRAASETISAEGRSPTDIAAKPYKYLLAIDREDDNLYPSLRGRGGARKFFADREIQWWRHQGFDAHRVNGPTRNMASSQIMCVNFMLPLAGIPGALDAVVREIDADVERVVDIQHEDRTSPVEFEWIGTETSLEGETLRGARDTSVNALVVAETSAGRRAYLIEWKYTEKYTRRDFGAGRTGRLRLRPVFPALRRLAQFHRRSSDDRASLRTVLPANAPSAARRPDGRPRRAWSLGSQSGRGRAGRQFGVWGLHHVSPARRTLP